MFQNNKTKFIHGLKKIGKTVLRIKIFTQWRQISKKNYQNCPNLITFKPNQSIQIGNNYISLNVKSYKDLKCHTDYKSWKMKNNYNPIKHQILALNKFKNLSKFYN